MEKLPISRDRFLPQIWKVNGLMAITPSFLNGIASNKRRWICIKDKNNSSYKP